MNEFLQKYIYEKLLIELRKQDIEITVIRKSKNIYKWLSLNLRLCLITLE